MAPEYSAPTAFDNFLVHQTMAEDPDLGIPSLSAVDFPTTTAPAGSMTDINSENIYREDMFAATDTQLPPGFTGADPYTTDWEGLYPDLFNLGNAQPLDYVPDLPDVPDVFAPDDFHFPAPSLPNGAGDVEELEASSNHDKTAPWNPRQ